MTLDLGIWQSSILGILLSLSPSPWTTSSASHDFNYHSPLSFTNLYSQSCQTPCLCSKSICPTAHFISPTAVQLSTLHMLKNQTPISHTSFYRDRRDLCHSFPPLCQKPQSFFNWTFTSYLWVITNTFWFYHFSSQGFSSLALSIPETADLFQALILSLLEYCNNFFAFKLSFLSLLSILLPKWDFLTNLTTSLLFS